MPQYVLTMEIKISAADAEKAQRKLLAPLRRYRACVTSVRRAAGPTPAPPISAHLRAFLTKACQQAYSGDYVCEADVEPTLGDATGSLAQTTAPALAAILHITEDAARKVRRKLTRELTKLIVQLGDGCSSQQLLDAVLQAKRR